MADVDREVSTMGGRLSRNLAGPSPPLDSKSDPGVYSVLMASDQRLIPILGIAGAVFAVASVVLFGLAFGFDPSGSELVERLRDAEPGDATLVRWGAITDMLGYYLFPVALIVVVRERIPWSSPSSRDLATVAGVLYGAIGAIGAGMLAAAAPPLIESAAPGSRAVLQTLAETVEGLWQWLEPVPFTVWAVGVTLALRARQTFFSALFGLMTVGGVLVWVGRILAVEPVLIAGLIAWLIPFPFVLATASWWSRSP